jgi:hypothetical protein
MFMDSELAKGELEIAIMYIEELYWNSPVRILQDDQINIINQKIPLPRQTMG